MTIAVGIRASDGVVIATDTQETVQNFWKREQHKLWIGGRAKAGLSGACVVSGAGNGGYCDALMHKLVDSFVAIEEERPMKAIGETFGDVVRQFHLDHVAPFSVDIPSVEMLIACQVNGQEGLWTTEKSTIAKQVAYATVGLGNAHASTVVSPIWQLNKMDVVSTIVLAAYAVFRAKEFVDGCGKHTDVVCLRDDMFIRANPECIDRLDRVFERFTVETEPAITGYLCEGGDGLVKASRSLRRIRKEAADLAARAIQPRKRKG